MPLAKIHVLEGRYDEGRIVKVSGAIQAAFMRRPKTSTNSSLNFRRTHCRLSAGIR
jgi:hypothetical protein